MRVVTALVVSFVFLFTGCKNSPTTTTDSSSGRASADQTSIRAVEVSGCKQYPTGIPKTSTAPDQDCIEYTYDGSNTLLLMHVNAGFNCCPTLDFEIAVEGDTITIEEIELEGLCTCLCLFDVDFEIQGLAPGTYHLVVIEPYRPAGEPVLEFTMDLVGSPSGEHCVYRSRYPWGLY
jgi:hypothetical protein